MDAPGRVAEILGSIYGIAGFPESMDRNGKVRRSIFSRATNGPEIYDPDASVVEFSYTKHGGMLGFVAFTVEVDATMAVPLMNKWSGIYDGVIPPPQIVGNNAPDPGEAGSYIGFLTVAEDRPRILFELAVKAAICQVNLRHVKATTRPGPVSGSPVFQIFGHVDRSDHPAKQLRQNEYREYLSNLTDVVWDGPPDPKVNVA